MFLRIKGTWRETSSVVSEITVCVCYPCRFPCVMNDFHKNQKFNNQLFVTRFLGTWLLRLLFFWFFWFFPCVFAVFWKRHVWFVWIFGLGSFVCYSKKQHKNQKSKQTKHAILKTCKYTWKKPKKPKKPKSQQPCVQESCYKKLVVELWFLCVWEALQRPSRAIFVYFGN